MSYKIAISGTHGTGKSTLVAALAQAFNTKSVAVVNEYARSFAMKTGNPDILMDGKNHPASQLLSLVHYPVLEFQAERQNPDLIICDRGVLDSLSYVKEVDVKFDDSELSYARELLYRHVKTYDRVFILPVEFGLAADGCRNEDTAFQIHMDEVIRSAWAEAGVPVIEVRGSVAERVQAIAAHLPK